MGIHEEDIEKGPWRACLFHAAMQDLIHNLIFESQDTF